MLLAGTAVLPLVVPSLLVWPRGGMASTSKSYEKARASVEKVCVTRDVPASSEMRHSSRRSSA